MSIKKKASLSHLDAGESAIFEGQTTHVMSKVYESKHKALKGLQIFQVNREVPSGSEIVEWRYFDEVGTAKIIADYAKDFPNVDVLAKKATARVRGLGNSYGYTIPEIRRAAQNGTQLDTLRGTAAKKFHDVAHDNIIWNGDSTYGLQGFIGYPGNSEVVLAAGAGGSKTFALKTPLEIFADFRAMKSAGSTLTGGRESYDTCLLPQEQYDLLEGLPVSDKADKTVLTYLKETYKDITLWMGVSELNGKGAGGTDRMYWFNRDAEHVEYVIPQDFEQMDPDKQGMSFVTVCHSESGGIIEKYPTAVLYADGI